MKQRFFNSTGKATYEVEGKKDYENMVKVEQAIDTILDIVNSYDIEKVKSGFWQNSFPISAKLCTKLEKLQITLFETRLKHDKELLNKLK